MRGAEGAPQGRERRIRGDWGSPAREGRMRGVGVTQLGREGRMRGAGVAQLGREGRMRGAGVAQLGREGKIRGGGGSPARE